MVARTESLTPYADAKRTENHESVRHAFANLLGVGSEQIVHWSPHRAMSKASAMSCLRSSRQTTPRPLRLTFETTKNLHIWLEREGIYFDLREEDGTRFDEPAQAALLEFTTAARRCYERRIHKVREALGDHADLHTMA